MSKEVLDGLCRAAEAIAIMFGKHCETIVHDFTNAQCQIVCIYNSSVSGRTEASTDTIYGMRISSLDCKELIPDEDYVNTMVTGSNGKQIKSSSINFVGEGYHYVLGINYDSTALSAMHAIIKDMLQTEKSFAASTLADKKLTEAIDYCISLMGKKPDQMNKADRMKVVSQLDESDVFSYQRAVPCVSERLGVSRYTVYNYLNELKGLSR